MSNLRPSLSGVVHVTVFVVIAIAVLRITTVVTLPVVLGLFVLILAWPFQRWQERRGVPRPLAYLLTLGAVLLVAALFLGLLYLAGQAIEAKVPEYADRASGVLEEVRKLLGQGSAEGEEGGEWPALQEQMGRFLGVFQSLVKGLYGFLGLMALTLTFFVLGLIETHGFREKLNTAIRPETCRRLVEAGEEMTTMFQRYMVARTIVSATTGLLVGLFTWAIGLDMPIVWGVTSFLLNYIPMLGSIVAVIPPTLVAFLHPELWVGFAALGGLTAIQFLIGNYLDPQIEGRILSLSPFVLFFSIIFWGWVWSVPGALIGIPLTAGLVIVCRKFETTLWFARLLAKNPEP